MRSGIFLVLPKSCFFFGTVGFPSLKALDKHVTRYITRPGHDRTVAGLGSVTLYHFEKKNVALVTSVIFLIFEESRSSVVVFNGESRK